MAKLNISWERGALTEAGSQEQSIHEFLGLDKSRPVLLFMESADPEQANTQKKINGLVFKDERVQIGTRFFTAVKLPWSRADERIAKLVGNKQLPTLAVFSLEGKRVGAIQSKHSPSKLFGLMKRAVKKDYSGTSLDAVVKKEQKILTEIDKIDSERKTLALAGGRKKVTTSAKREIEKKRELLAKREAKLLQSESELWKTIYTKVDKGEKAL